MTCSVRSVGTSNSVFTLHNMAYPFACCSGVEYSADFRGYKRRDAKICSVINIPGCAL